MWLLHGEWFSPHFTTSRKVPVSPHNDYASCHFITCLTPSDNLPNTSWSTTSDLPHLYLSLHTLSVTSHISSYHSLHALLLSPQTLALPPHADIPPPHAPHISHHLPSPTTTPILSPHPLHITAHSLSLSLSVTLSESPVTHLTPLNESTEVKPQTECSNNCTAAKLEGQLWLNGHLNGAV